MDQEPDQAQALALAVETFSVRVVLTVREASCIESTRGSHQSKISTSNSTLEAALVHRRQRLRTSTADADRCHGYCEEHYPREADRIRPVILTELNPSQEHESAYMTGLRRVIVRTQCIAPTQEKRPIKKKAASRERRKTFSWDKMQLQRPTSGNASANATPVAYTKSTNVSTRNASVTLPHFGIFRQFPEKVLEQTDESVNTSSLLMVTPPPLERSVPNWKFAVDPSSSILNQFPLS